MSDLEKLERLEQSITQLLYEVDSNFSKCHRIITTNILPIVEKYAENSGQVWEHSKFWKQFFEASANVSLSGYEEQADQDPGDTTMQRQGDSSMLDATDARQTPRNDLSQRGTGQSPYDLTGDDGSSDILSGSRMQTQTPLNRRMESLEISSSPGNPPTPQTVLRSQHDQVSYAESATPTSSPMYRSAVEKLNATATPMTAPRSRNNKNPLLHRVLDSNWKVQATPHSTHNKYRSEQHTNQSTSPTSSPPELVSRFGTSMRASQSRKTPSKSGGPYYDSDDDSSIGQMSPPVTMAFSLPPSKLLRTPAKEAARHMVDEILRTAGANDLSTIPSETPQDPLGSQHGRADEAPGQSTFLPGTQTTQNESRRLFEIPNNSEDTPIIRKGTGVLDNWQESAEGSHWL